MVSPGCKAALISFFALATVSVDKYFKMAPNNVAEAAIRAILISGHVGIAPAFRLAITTAMIPEKKEIPALLKNSLNVTFMMFIFLV